MLNNEVKVKNQALPRRLTACGLKLFFTIHDNKLLHDI